ncbi:hypothetical protein Y1Q_0002410 [Alligator mississippiensis]|uniref:Uncharacterized protein n=1 Tax=Alligator mississippiensis TaxID=8496 RepID=A0A151N6C3_ALLMI|nr:hypothetical protein Y1Q_0002410 [Alligator mississippiensis]
MSARAPSPAVNSAAPKPGINSFLLMQTGACGLPRGHCFRLEVSAFPLPLTPEKLDTKSLALYSKGNSDTVK